MRWKGRKVTKERERIKSGDKKGEIGATFLCNISRYVTLHCFVLSNPEQLLCCAAPE
jgi:hypothetical protein